MSQEESQETPSEEKPAAEENPVEETEEKRKKDPAAVWTRRVLALFVLFFIWYLFADRFTPYTSQARVRGYVIPIVPQVSGLIAEVTVDINEPVEKRQVLVKIDPTDYDLAVTEAESALEKAGQGVGAGTADVAAATASLAEAKASLEFDKRHGERMFRAEKTGAVSTSQADQARSRIARGEAQVKVAEAQLEQARQSLGQQGEDNADIRAAQAALESAQLNLSRTVVMAPDDGGVTNVRVETGQYAGAGKPLMTFVSSRTVWIEAFMRENSLGHMDEGDAVDIVLDVAPGRIFKGKVQSIGYGVDWGGSDSAAELPKVDAQRDWLRDPQRFPVIIVFEEEELEPMRGKGLLREGGQVDVMIYTREKNPVLNPLARIWIKFVSWASYVR